MIDAPINSNHPYVRGLLISSNLRYGTLPHSRYNLVNQTIARQVS
jgi:hypothetical protein